MIQLYLKELSRVQDELIDPRALFKELHVCYYLEQKRTLFFLINSSSSWSSRPI